MLSLIKKMFPANYKRTFKEHLGVPSLHWSLQNLKKIGFTSRFALDVGAYEGEWAKLFTQVFPQAKVLMVEAQAAKEVKLKQLCQTDKRLSYHLALLSDASGQELYFNENETASHVSEDRNDKSKVVVTESLDDVLKSENFPAVDFLKLDVQGYEKQVLKGGTKALDSAHFCLMEVTLLELDPSPLVLEMMNFMDSRGFQLYDITQFMRRPYDKALYQCDFLFIRKSSPYISEKRWS